MAKRGRRLLRKMLMGENEDEDPDESRNSKVRIVALVKRQPIDERGSVDVLTRAIDEIFTRSNASGMSFEQLYRHAYNLVQNRHADALYSAFQLKLTTHLSRFRSVIFAAAETGLTLTLFCRMWLEFSRALQVIKEVLSPLDRSLGKKSIYETGLKLWKDEIVTQNSLQHKLTYALLSEVERERNGEMIDRGLMRATVNMLIDIDEWKVFETPFIADSVDFYSREAQRLLEFSDCSEVLKGVMKRLEEECARVTNYLIPSLRVTLSKIVGKMIGGRLQQLVDTGLVSMLEQDRFEDLERMYELFQLEERGVSIICDSLKSHLVVAGKQLVQDTEQQKDPVAFIERLMAYWSKYEKIVNSCCKYDKRVQLAVMSAFEKFFLENRRLPEFLSLYVDSKLRQSDKLDDGDIEAVFDKVMVLFRFLGEKDLFEKYYKHHLAKRLMIAKSVDEEAEKNFILKLKTACGYQFTVKMENMFNDVKTSADLMQRFNSSSMSAAAKAGEASIQVQVLTTGSWPPYPSSKCILPKEIEQASERFKAFYVNEHKGRRLNWQYNLGDADLKLKTGESSTKLLNVSTYQMCILMLFNDADRLSFSEIQQATDMPRDDLRKNLQSLSLVKGKNVLVKEPMSKEIAESDMFAFNEKFTSKMARIKMCRVAAQRESGEESGATRTKVEEERKLQIDAAIVRVMKARQVMEHNALLSEVITQLQHRFSPNPATLKQRIAALIDREFLERDPDDRKRYRYVA